MRYSILTPGLLALLLTGCDRPTATEPPANARPLEIVVPPPLNDPGEALVRADVEPLLGWTPKRPPATWADSLLVTYVRESRDPLIVAARRGPETLEWELDRVARTDTATYMIYQLGHETAEPDGRERRFATDGWVYLDSATARVYEYDLPNDRLRAWPPTR